MLFKSGNTFIYSLDQILVLKTTLMFMKATKLHEDIEEKVVYHHVNREFENGLKLSQVIIKDTQSFEQTKILMIKLFFH